MAVSERRELFVIEFVAMERIRAGSTARFRIVVAVRRGDQQNSGWLQHAMRFGQQILPAIQMFDDFKGSDKVECRSCERQRFAGGLEKTHA